MRTPASSYATDRCKPHFIIQIKIIHPLARCVVSARSFIIEFIRHKNTKISRGSRQLRRSLAFDRVSNRTFIWKEISSLIWPNRTGYWMDWKQGYEVIVLIRILCYDKPMFLVNGIAIHGPYTVHGRLIQHSAIADAFITGQSRGLQ